jgi:acetolactate synthase-1/2/3 large subunit
VPDYARLAEAYGAVGLCATTPDEVDAVIDKAFGVDDRPCVIDFRVDPAEMCFPMVPAGASNDDIILGPEPSQDAIRKFRPAAVPAEAAVRGT